MASPQITALASSPLRDESDQPAKRSILTHEYSDVNGLDELSIARGSDVCARLTYEFFETTEDDNGRIKRRIRFENIWFSGKYINTYGKLHWPRAFGSAGSGCYCCSRARGNSKSVRFSPLVSPCLWIAWRIFVCAYLIGVFLYSIINFWEEGTWFYYLTNWQTTIFALYGIFALLSALYIQLKYRNTLTGDYTSPHDETFSESAKMIAAHRKSMNKEDYKIPTLVRMTWALHGLSMSLGIWVTLLFWLNAAVFGLRDPSRAGYELIDHFSTVFLVILDFSFASFPWLLFQFVWSSLIAIAFAVWSAIHFHLGLTNKFDNGNYLYKGVDWNKPTETGLAIAALILIGVPCISIAVWILGSESMGRCGAGRIVPWVDQDGSGGHRLKSMKKGTVKPQSGDGKPIVADV